MHKKKSFKFSRVLFCIKIFVGILIAISFIKIFIFDIKKVKGNSMLPTLQDGQIIFLFKLAYGIKHPFKNKYFIRWAEPKLKDIVIFVKRDHFAVKRITGISLSPIEFNSSFDYNMEQVQSRNSYFYQICVEGRCIYLNSEQFRNLGGFSKERSAMFVPEGTVFAIGDNVYESYDSRDYGFVHIDSIYAKVLLWK